MNVSWVKSRYFRCALARWCLRSCWDWARPLSWTASHHTTTTTTTTNITTRTTSTENTPTPTTTLRTPTGYPSGIPAISINPSTVMQRTPYVARLKKGSTSRPGPSVTKSFWRPSQATRWPSEDLIRESRPGLFFFFLGCLTRLAPWCLLPF